MAPFPTKIKEESSYRLATAKQPAPPVWSPVSWTASTTISEGMKASCLGGEDDMFGQKRKVIIIFKLYNVNNITQLILKIVWSLHCSIYVDCFIGLKYLIPSEKLRNFL